MKAFPLFWLELNFCQIAKSMKFFHCSFLGKSGVFVLFCLTLPSPYKYYANSTTLLMLLLNVSGRHVLFNLPLIQYFIKLTHAKLQGLFCCAQTLVPPKDLQGSGTWMQMQGLFQSAVQA